MKQFSYFNKEIGQVPKVGLILSECLERIAAADSWRQLLGAHVPPLGAPKRCLAQPNSGTE